MKVIFKCEFCEYQSKDGTVGAKIDVQEHERGCVHNPKNLTIDHLIKVYSDLYDAQDDYTLGARYIINSILKDLKILKTRYEVKL